MIEGWLCPVCKKVYSPFITECTQCPSKLADKSEFEEFMKRWRKNYAESKSLDAIITGDDTHYGSGELDYHFNKAAMEARDRETAKRDPEWDRNR